MDSHHRCTTPGCKHAELFTAKGQLDRHRRSKHGIGSKALYFCHKSDCERGPNGRGFIRKDHMIQHVKSHRERLSHHIAAQAYKAGDTEALSTVDDLANGVLQRSSPSGNTHQAEELTPSTWSLGGMLQISGSSEMLSAMPLNQEERLSINYHPTLVSSSQAAVSADDALSSRKRRRVPDLELDSEVVETISVKKLQSDKDELLDENQRLKAEVARLKGVIKEMANAL